MILLQPNTQSWHEKMLTAIINLPWLYIILGIIILLLILKQTQKSLHSHWSTLIPDFKYLSKDFYSELKRELLSHNIQGISTSFITLKEGGMTSSRRIYLRIEWKNYQYDMCCAPFGDGLFLSSWLLYKISLGQIIVSRIPFAGDWLTRKFYPVTYYKIDTASMFMTYCHNAMLKVADNITKDAGIRINDTDRKPILKDIFKR